VFRSETYEWQFYKLNRDLYTEEKKRQWKVNPDVPAGCRYNVDKNAYRYGVILGE